MERLVSLLLVSCLALSLSGCREKPGIEEQALLPAVQQGEMLFDFYGRDDISAFAADFYDDPPKKAVVFMDSWNKTEIELSDAGSVAAVFEAMKKVRVVEPVDIYVTDNYNDIAFVMKDGKAFHFSFNRYHLEYDGKVYALADDAALWELLRAYCDTAEP